MSSRIRMINQKKIIVHIKINKKCGVFLLSCIFKFNFFKKIKTRIQKDRFTYSITFCMKNHRFVE